MQNLLETKSFLIIDDFGDMRSMLRSMLSMYGVTRIDTAADGKESIQQLERNKYDVVLCDYNLGAGKDGQQVLEEARHRGLVSCSTVFVMITAENTQEMVLGAMEYEPDSYLSKPFTKDLLASRLEKLLLKKQDLDPVEKALARNDYAAALRTLEGLIASKPKNLAELTRLKAELCLKAGDYDAAAGIYEKVLAIREMPWARLGLGRVLYAKKQYAEAREIFQDLVYENNRLTLAYDWLARACLALGDAEEAQEVLTTAAELSPKAILRQKTLGELAMKNKDVKTAERAFSRAVNLGKHSIYKHPALYSRLVEAKVSNEDAKGALAVLKQLDREFGRDREAQLYGAMSEAVVHKALGNEEAARKAMEKAEQTCERLGLQGNPEITLAMARTAVRLGGEERARSMLDTVVRNNHENDELLREVEAVYVDLGLAEHPGELIAGIRKEILDLNNQGVSLANQGRIDEAVGLFETAAEGMSGNRTINLNAAKVLMMQMEKTGADADSIARARKYIERTRKIAPTDPALAKVVEKFQRLVSQV